MLAAVASSALGGMAAAVTRFALGASDPVTLAVFRFGLGFLLLLPLALALRVQWPRGRDWLAVAALGVMFYGAFFVVYGEALVYTTAARGSLAVSTLPLLTMIVAALLGREALTRRKSVGVILAIGGVAIALGAGLSGAPAQAWRGDLIMLTGMLAMALYNVLSRPLMSRSSALGYAAAGMGFGSGFNALAAWHGGGFERVPSFGAAEWLAALYLGALGGALAFYLWVYALQRTTPTRVANTITVSPIAAALLAAVLLGEPIGASLVIGVAAVAAGIWIASTEAAGKIGRGERI
ncbi:MAG TPA: DMT family transporter [Burkholderiales bacterium]|nr:DMT family transporter [Burkholderiales bacterium]